MTKERRSGGFSVAWTREAEEDLKEIILYIRVQESQGRAGAPRKGIISGVRAPPWAMDS